VCLIECWPASSSQVTDWDETRYTGISLRTISAAAYNRGFYQRVEYSGTLSQGYVMAWPFKVTNYCNQGCGSGSGRIRTFLVASGKFSPDPIGTGTFFGYVKLYQHSDIRTNLIDMKKIFDVWIDFWWVQVGSGSGFKNSDLLDPYPAENGSDPQPWL